MICPYNGFRNMDCEQCAAWQQIANPGNKIYKDIIFVCVLARNGGAVPNRQLMYIPEQNSAERS